MKISSLLRFIITLQACVLPSLLRAQAESKPNIIFIVLDDLNDYVSSLGGNLQSVTPNIKELEESGTTFTNAYASSPRCSPSRTSFVSGKDLAYTGVYNNSACKAFRDYFTEEDGNEEVYTLPEFFKDYGGYYTYNINKIYHCFDSQFDYDSLTADPCLKQLSWNKYSLFTNGEDQDLVSTNTELGNSLQLFAGFPIDNSYEEQMYDYRAVDSAGLFLRELSADEMTTCGKPFFMMVGFRKPHEKRMIPEKYFEPYYVNNFYEVPFNLPYNNPINSFPFNGTVMPPQPDTAYNDFFQLPETGLAAYMAAFDSTYFEIEDLVNDFDPLPTFGHGYTVAERKEIAAQVINSNYVLAYIASVKFVDAQVGRLLDTLDKYPEIKNNTIIVLAGDHGYSLGEKRHWKKGTLWETDLRVPFVICDLRSPEKQTINTSVSLLDVFPTLCDMVGIEMPEFADGSAYLDGQSLMHLLDDPDLYMERPTLSSYAESGHGQLSCKPQHSVRNDRFHYLLFSSNGPEGTLNCNNSDYYTEELLYEVGVNHEVDPNEWNNLATNADYTPVINYLQQWLPDSALYLQKTLIARINSPNAECLPGEDDLLTFTFNMYDEMGSAITPPDSLWYTWTNNFSDTVISGVSTEFSLTDLPEGFYDENTSMLWYLHGYGTDSVVRAFDIRKVFFNPEVATPEISFTINEIDDITVRITDIEVSGAYTGIRWDFGDGEIIEADNPGYYTYNEPGIYTISCIVNYGNNDSCEVVRSKSVNFIDLFNIQQEVLHIYPNPTSGVVYLTSEVPFDNGEILVHDVSGKLLMTEKVLKGPLYAYSINLQHLPQGVYQVTFQNGTYRKSASCVVLHN